jgi:hypothetical protein
MRHLFLSSSNPRLHLVLSLRNPCRSRNPRSSPPKVTPPGRRDVQVSEPQFRPPVGPALSHVPTGPIQREKESSPGPRELEGTRRRSQPWLRIQGQEPLRVQVSSSANALSQRVLSCNPYDSQPHTIVADVSQAFDDIQAPRDAVKSTTIALVRVDSTFLPGTTIGATHWVAYAMTKGASFYQT